MSQAAGADRIPLRPAGPHAFGAAYDWSVRFTFNVANGAATGLTFEQGKPRPKLRGLSDVPRLSGAAASASS
jgi:hypothetical protein